MTRGIGFSRDFATAESALRWFASAVDEVDDVAIADLAEAGERQELLLSDLANTIRIGTEMASKFASALDAPEAGRVFWLERQGPLDRIAFRSAPLDVSGLLQERLFKKTESGDADVGDAGCRRAMRLPGVASRHSGCLLADRAVAVRLPVVGAALSHRRHAGADPSRLSRCAGADAHRRHRRHARPRSRALHLACAAERHGAIDHGATCRTGASRCWRSGGMARRSS